MLVHPDIDPVALALGPVQIHWYGIMYLLGFMSFYLLGQWLAKRSWIALKPEQVGDALFYGALGVIIGGRVVYMLFYDFPGFVENPFNLLAIWRGGMSFHGGFLGVMIGQALYARSIGLQPFQVIDVTATVAGMGLFFGRLGNFINGELWGRPTDVPWAMIFPQVDALPRHPSMLYEAILEGLLMLGIMLWFLSRPRPAGAATGLSILVYGLARFAVEFVREPDAQLGFIAWGWLTMGQILSTPMIIGGTGLIMWAYQRDPQLLTARKPDAVHKQQAAAKRQAVARSTDKTGKARSGNHRKPG